MSLVRFYPVSNVDSLQRQMNRLFDELTSWDNYPTNNTTWKPAIELIDQGDNFILRAIVPGVKAQDLDISVTRETVNISGELHNNQEKPEKGYYVSEFRYGKFERTIALPVAVQNDKVTADYKDGILTLNIPKVEELKNKVVKINLGEESQPTLEAQQN